MSESPKKPRLRRVQKYRAPYDVNRFPASFPLDLGKEVVYLLATRGKPRLEGEDWEEIFARLVKAEWKPSNVGLDDVVLGGCAWGAKTVKVSNPVTASRVRLISGRNSPVFSFERTIDTHSDPLELGKLVVSIWNERVKAIKKEYREARTVVLLKSNDLMTLGVFEFETTTYDPADFIWSWNKRHNLVAHGQESKLPKFTWQPHGSQFTISETIPDKRIAIRIKKSPRLDREAVLNTLEFDPSWIELMKS